MPDRTRHLKPLNTLPKEEARRIQSMGGRTISKSKSDGAKWRQIRERIKKEGLTDKDAAWLMERIENRDAMSSDILIHLEKIKNEPDLDIGQRLSLNNAMLGVAKFVHGEKSKVEVSSVNLNIDVTREEVEAHIKKIFGDKGGDI